jgi:hypothetical protein
MNRSHYSALSVAVGSSRENCDSMLAILSREAKYSKYCRRLSRHSVRGKLPGRRVAQLAEAVP